MSHNFKLNGTAVQLDKLFLFYVNSNESCEILSAELLLKAIMQQTEWRIVYHKDVTDALRF